MPVLFVGIIRPPRPQRSLRPFLFLVAARAGETGVRPGRAGPFTGGPRAGPAVAGGTRLGLAVGVTRRGAPRPLQATGGWLD